ncbi:MAG: hypothetical protein NC826_00910 [Candidatus Omnitrophica bacterium]|nr:hypothetical protein [Candidatus Omnitrophota bacterium]
MNNQNYYRHPGIAVALSFLFTGLGQLYNGQIKKGILIIFFSSLSIILTVIGAVLIGLRFLDEFCRYNFTLSILGLGFFITGLIFICILGIFGMVDAFKEAQRINKE